MDPISIASLGAGVISGLGNIFGGNATNRMNLQIAREQMAFQERMSNTAHQREADDLRAAGMNPIMTATGGSGASTPSGASANMINPYANLGKHISPEVILGVQQARANIDKTQAETMVAKNSALNLVEQNKNLGVQNELLQRQAEKLLVDMGMTKVQARRVVAETNDINYELAGKVAGGQHKYDSTLVNSLKGITRMLRDGEISNYGDYAPYTPLPRELQY